MPRRVERTRTKVKSSQVERYAKKISISQTLCQNLDGIQIGIQMKQKELTETFMMIVDL